MNKSPWGLNYYKNIPADYNKFLNETARLSTLLAEYDAGTKTIILEELEIKSTKQYVKEEGPFYRDGNIMGEPDVRIVPDSMNIRNGDIYTMLQRAMTGGSFFLVDNVPTKESTVAGLHVNQIAFVNVHESPQPIYGGRGAGGVVNIFLKTGREISNNYEKPNFINLEHPGYHKVKEFYSPDYTVAKPEHKKPDLRTTLFWEPNVTVDSTGVARVVFYTGDVETNYHVEIEGISANGDPINRSTGFKTVSNQNN